MKRSLPITRRCAYAASGNPISKQTRLPYYPSHTRDNDNPGKPFCITLNQHKISPAYSETHIQLGQRRRKQKTG
jgi:hypothetical protein